MNGEHALGMAATKLRPPASPTRLVRRSRLADLLTDAVAKPVPLLLVTAPAGSGKSTLIAAWALDSDRPVAWLQVEAADSDPAGFWSSLVAAIGRCRPDVASVVGPLVAGSQGDGRVIVPAIINAVECVGDPLVIVIDDYHLIDSDAVHRGVERLIDLCPEQLTLVVPTRVDPPFRLGRMRVRNRICEIRAEHLRFATDEATVLLGAAGDDLSPEQLTNLCSKTEGWAAGLVLAGLSLERASDANRFVDAFRGDDELVISYLSDEFLDAMSAGDRQRLLETAVLDHLTGPLIGAVTGSTDGTTWLADIASRNQLIVRLDSTGEWFRYHHLLHDLLLLEARRTIPKQLSELHRRAADWFADNGDSDQAVVHRFAAGDIPGAIQLMYVVGPELLGRGQTRKLAIDEVERGDNVAAHATAREAIIAAESFGLANYHGVAQVFAIRGRTTSDTDQARSDVSHALQLARRATTDLGLAYVLTICGDTLADLDDDAGAALIVEARTRIDRCVDPGVAGRYLARVESRHHLASASQDPTRSTRLQLTERELAVLRYFPTKLPQRDIAAALFVSLNTVKTHSNAIFRKLDVSDCKSAIQAARERHLL